MRKNTLAAFSERPETFWQHLKLGPRGTFCTKKALAALSVFIHKNTRGAFIFYM